MLRTAILAFLSTGLALCQGDAPLKQLVAINEAATIYYSWLKRVPTSMQQLGPGNRKIADASAADLINRDLASGIQGGYQFTLTGTKEGWTVMAVPLTAPKGSFQTKYTIESRIPGTMRPSGGSGRD